jgi:hypothetical protein
MGGGISFSMPVVVGKRYDPIQGRDDIPRDVRVSILIDCDRRRSVRDKNLAEALLDPTVPDSFRYEFGNVDHFAPGLGADGE